MAQNKENERRNVKIVSYKGDHYDFEGSFSDLENWKNSRLEEIPEEYRDKAIIDSDTEYGYGGSERRVFYVYYYRLENDDEYSDRLEMLKADEAAERERDLKTFEALKKKLKV